MDSISLSDGHACINSDNDETRWFASTEKPLHGAAKVAWKSSWVNRRLSRKRGAHGVSGYVKVGNEESTDGDSASDTKDHKVPKGKGKATDPLLWL